MQTKLILPLAALALAGTSQAQLFLDHFDQPGYPVGQTVSIVGSGAPLSNSGTATGLSMPLGSTRDVTLDRQFEQGGGSGGDYVFINTTLNASRLNLQSDLNADNKITILYDNNGVAGGIGLDLSNPSFPNLFMFGAANDQITDYSVTLFDGANSWTVTQTTPAGYSGDLAFSLAAFSSHSVILSSIDSLTLVVDPRTYGGDVNIHAIALVPEPQEYALALGFLGLGFVAVRRYRNK